MRKATIEDAPRILEWMMAYFLETQKEAPMDYEFNVIKVQNFLKVALAHPSMIVLVDDEGYIMGGMEENWFSDTKVACGVAWYVCPKARNGFLALRLLRAFEREAAEHGARFTKIDLRNKSMSEIGKIGRFSRGLA